MATTRFSVRTVHSSLDFPLHVVRLSTARPPAAPRQENVGGGRGVWTRRHARRSLPPIPAGLVASRRALVQVALEGDDRTPSPGPERRTAIRYSRPDRHPQRPGIPTRIDAA